MRILVIEDEPRLANTIAKVLRQEHYDVDIAFDGEEALDLALTDAYDVLLVDRMLPKRDGMAVLREVRAADIHTPALMLTALDDVDHRVEGLRGGADDYLGKPFAFEELLARIESLLRRRDKPINGDQQTIGGLSLIQADESVQFGGARVQLTHREFVLLETLVLHAGQTVTRDQLLERVWGYDADPAGNVVELYVHYVRRKLAALGDQPGAMIKTVRGIGYRIDAGGTAPQP